MAVKSSKYHNSAFDSTFAPTTAYYPYAQHVSISPTTLGAYENWPTYSDFSPTTLHQQLTPHTSPSPPTADEVVALQMQHLRFPTPPITPPFNSAYNAYKLAAAAAAAAAASTTSPAKEVRTQSVIMKIGQNHLVGNCSSIRMPPTPEHVDDIAVDIVGLDDAAVDSGAESLRHETRMTSATSSASSSPKHSEYTCEWIDCGRDHNTLEALAAHVTKIHAVASPSDGLYYCRWHGCSRLRGFSARYKMLVHARTHTKEKPHQCHLCTKSFSRAENLKIHIRSHSGEKPYLCTYEGCNKAYSNSSDRFKHTRTHAMDKPYMCKVPGCQKRYTDPSSLRKHVKTFKHATQLIATAAITPCKTGIFDDTIEDSVTVHGAPLHVQNPNVVATHAESETGNRHLHAGTADTYTQGYADATSTIPVCQLCVPPPPPPHYYLTAMEEDLCSSIKAAQLDYYYATASHSPARSSTASSSWSSNLHSDGSTGLAIELEAPLDLRVNRR